MSFASPDIAYTTHPTDALFSAHLKSSVFMAVYLIGGASLTAAALVGVGYTEQLRGTWALLPYALMAAMLLWFGLGAAVLNKQKQQLERCDQRYNAHINQRTPTVAPTVAPPDADEPWELRAFWGNDEPRAATAPVRAYTHAAVAQLPSATAPASRTGSKTSHSNATELELELIACMTEHKPLRPISLFGSVQ